MNAYLSKEDLARLPVDRNSFAEHYAAARSRRPGLFARIAAYFERQSTLHDLRALTDRELADIGLDRSNLHRVFEPAYARAR